MANPRKFSEKIALHNQKQAEETAAFEKIMREVSDATTVKVCWHDESIYNDSLILFLSLTSNHPSLTSINVTLSMYKLLLYPTVPYRNTGTTEYK